MPAIRRGARSRKSGLRVAWRSAIFELAGTKSNRLALNARIKIVAGGMTQTDEIHSGGSYLSQNDLRVHFGLGTARKIDKVEVRWPSGSIETFSDLAVDRFYSVLEGHGIASAERVRPVPKRPCLTPWLVRSRC